MYRILTISILFILLMNIQALNTPALTEEINNINIELALQEVEKEKTKSDPKTALEEILEKHYQAIGGPEAWQAVNTLKFAGSMYTKEATFKTAAVYKRPDLCRVDFQAGNLYFMESYDGKIPWQMNPGARNGPEILKGKRAKEMIDTCDFEGPLVNHELKGHKIKYMGREKVGDRWGYLLEVKFKTGNTDKYYLDTETYLPFMVKGSTTIQDQVVNTTINISEYIEIGDIRIPFSYEFIVDGNPSTETLKIKNVELNSEIDDNIFKLPKRPQDLR
jgi:outer membrane lipoprotein-sorting protein